ncbi:MAG: hypothetical protein QXI58_01970 [Candidatus Micrarchaeia archaeon]
MVIGGFVTVTPAGGGSAIGTYTIPKGVGASSVGAGPTGFSGGVGGGLSI